MVTMNDDGNDNERAMTMDGLPRQGRGMRTGGTKKPDFLGSGFLMDVRLVRD